nr:hypothetical protein [Tanacetum cinerariifolium]
MATTLDQQVALNEALVPSAQRLWIGRSNFRLPLNIQSKEPTLQVVYDVLHVLQIYMHEFWAIAKLYQHSIRFKMDTRKHVLDLEAFREMLHISPRIPGQSFAEFPFEEDILEFLRFLGHNTQIKTLTDVHINKLYQPWRSFAAVINKCLTGKSSGIDSLRISQAQILWGVYHGSNVVSRHQTTQQYGVILPIELTTEDIKNSKAYKEYYACATGEAAPKPKASARKKKSGSASSTTPPPPIATPTPTTNVVAAPRLSVAAKGKQPTRATTPTEPIDVERTEAEQLKILLKRSRQETHISQQRGSGIDEGTGSRPGVEHKNQKRSNEMYYPRFTKVIIDYVMTRKPSISRRNRINWHYVRDDVPFSTIKVHLNRRRVPERRKGESASSTTPPTPTPTTTVESAPRLSITAKGKQPSRATTPTEPTDVQRTEAEQLKIVLKRSRQETHISQQSGSGTDEGTDVGGHEEGNKSDESDDDRDEGSDDDSEETVKAGAGKDDDDDDDEDDDDNDEEEELAKSDKENKVTGKGGDEVRESEGESDEEETRQEKEESFDPIPRTPEESKEESNDEEEQDLRLSEEARIQEEEDADELYRDVNINQGKGLQVTQNVEDTHVTLTPINPDGPQEISSMLSFVSSMLNPISDERLRSLETSFSEYRQTNPFADAVFAIPGIVHQYMTQQMKEAVREGVQIQTDRLQDSLQRENDEFLCNIDEN